MRAWACQPAGKQSPPVVVGGLLVAAGGLKVALVQGEKSMSLLISLLAQRSPDISKRVDNPTIHTHTLLR